MTVNFIKLISGEMVVGTVDPDFSREGVVRLKKALFIMPLGPNQVGFQALTKFIKKDQIDLQTAHCLINEQASTEIESAYTQSISSIQHVTAEQAAASGLILS